MHLFGSTQYGVDRASLNALGATNTFRFTDIGDCGNFFLSTMLRIQWFEVSSQQVRQVMYCCFTAWWAFVNAIALDNGFGVGAAARVAALAALGLWQDAVHLIDDGIGLNRKFDSGIAKGGPTSNGQQYEGNNGIKIFLYEFHLCVPRF